MHDKINVVVKYSMIFINLELGMSSSNNSDSRSSIPIIAGTIGGVVLFIIILLIVVLLYWKWRLHKKKTYSISITNYIEDTTSEFTKGL